jgi:hypothetical protein
MWWLNRYITAAFDAGFSVMESWPGWLSLLVLAAVTGILALLAFRYTSNQAAIGRVRDDLKANLLAVRLFKDDVLVTLRSEGRLFVAAGKLFLFSLQPLAVMIVPMCLLLVQMGLRYEWLPLRTGQAAVVTARLRAAPTGDSEPVLLEAPPGVTIEVGPSRKLVPVGQSSAAEVEMVWRVRPTAPGRHQLTIRAGSSAATKELTAADSTRPLIRVSRLRPGSNATDQLFSPAEPPAHFTDRIQDIEVTYPSMLRRTPVFGCNIHWLITYFVSSTVIALLAKPFLKVKL